MPGGLGRDDQRLHDPAVFFRRDRHGHAVSVIIHREENDHGQDNAEDIAGHVHFAQHHRLGLQGSQGERGGFLRQTRLREQIRHIQGFDHVRHPIGRDAAQDIGDVYRHRRQGFTGRDFHNRGGLALPHLRLARVQVLRADHLKVHFAVGRLERLPEAREPARAVKQIAHAGFLRRFRRGRRRFRGFAPSSAHQGGDHAGGKDQYQHDRRGDDERLFPDAVPQGKAENRPYLPHCAPPTFSTKISCREGSRISNRSGKSPFSTISLRNARPGRPRRSRIPSPPPSPRSGGGRVPRRGGVYPPYRIPTGAYAHTPP